MSSNLFESQSGGGSSSSNDFTMVAITNANSPYSASWGEFIVCDTSGGAITVTPPAAAGNSGKRFVVYKSTSDFTVVTITGLTTLNTIGEDVTFVSDGSTRLQYTRRVPNTWVSYTPTGSWVTNTTYTGFWRRAGDSIELQIRVATSGAPTAATLTASLPSGLSIDTAKLNAAANTAGIMGTARARDNDGTAVYGGQPRYNDTTTVVPLIINAASTTFAAVNATTPFTFAANDSVEIYIAGLPISGWPG